jgi:OFA family oxalate/formate antiporter-like MFS transporter
MAASTFPVVPPQSRVVNRWIQLVAGMIAMMAIANLQYAWTLFTSPMMKNLHASLAAVQVAFATFILAETWLVPFEGFLVDKFGPRLMMMFGGVLVAFGWFGAGRATTVRELIVVYTIGGIGAGVVYGGTIGNALKWFPDHRGLCVGLTAGSYGIGTALTVAPIAKMLKASGYQHTMAVWGLIQGAVVLLAALMIVKPPKSWVPPGWDKKEDELNKLHHLHTSHLDCTPLQMLKTPSFYLIYVMMTIVAFGGLVVTAQLSPIAKFYKVDTVTIAFGMSALVLAIEVDRILNGLTRPFWGWVSDHIGRENTMFVAFAMEALAVFALLQLIHKPVWFILLSGLTFFAWGEIFSLFPAITGDLFGKTWATTNYGIVYTAKGLASIFAGPVAAMVSVKAGNWVPIFYAMIACDLVAALLALLVLKPVAERTIDRNEKLRAEALAAVTVEKSRPVKGVA